MTKDYTITMRDDTGRVCAICVNGASIDELLAVGYTLNEAHESVRSNAFEVAVRDGEIGAQAVLIADEYDAGNSK